jgi:hypothetical protein
MNQVFLACPTFFTGSSEANAFAKHLAQENVEMPPKNTHDP